jgi:hypothetical protein
MEMEKEKEASTAAQPSFTSPGSPVATSATSHAAFAAAGAATAAAAATPAAAVVAFNDALSASEHCRTSTEGCARVERAWSPASTRVTSACAHLLRDGA